MIKIQLKERLDLSLMAFPNYYIMLSSFDLHQTATLDHFSFPHNHYLQFYTNFSESICPITELKQNNRPINQESENDEQLAKHKKPLKKISQKKHSKRLIDLSKQKFIEKIRIPKIYKKDQDRNILPNTINKIFFFLRSKKKSKNLLQKILQSNSKYSLQISSNKFYTYQNLIRLNLKRYMTEQTLEKLFILIDPQQKIFSFQQQITFIKINAILIKNFIKKHLYLQAIGIYAQKNQIKIKIHLQKYRKILEKTNQYVQIAKEKLKCKQLGEKNEKNEKNKGKSIHID